jgi:signal transduction histidine kinase
VETFLISVGLVDVVLQVTGSMPFATADIVFNVIHLALVVYSLGVVYFLLRKKNKLTTILVLGSFILVLCASISIIDALFITKGQMSDAYYAYYIELGIIGELLFLNYGLNYKTKMEQNEKTRMEVERQMMLANERNRISADLHDDIGATLSSMHIYGDLASSLWESQPEESKEMVGKISRQSKDLMERMSDIVWSLRPPGEENSLITTRLRNYTHELLGGKNIAVILEIDELLAEKIINPMARKNILLIVKESVNNIAKYSEATQAGIAFVEHEHTMELRISDNGTGFKNTGTRNGNGMGNMEQRCKQMGGYCNIESSPGKGVLIRCFFPLAIISHIG